MSMLDWFRENMQTNEWLREQADVWARQHFPQQQHTAAIVARLLVENVGLSFADFVPASEFIKDLDMNDLEPVLFFEALEEELKISISDEDAERLATVADLVVLCERLQSTMK